MNMEISEGCTIAENAFHGYKMKQYSNARMHNWGLNF
jgi:hypothetical protein